MTSDEAVAKMKAGIESLDELAQVYGIEDPDQRLHVLSALHDLLMAARQESYPVAAVYYNIGEWSVLFPVQFVDAMEHEWGSGWWRRYRDTIGSFYRLRYELKEWLNTGEIPRKEQ